MKTIIFSTILLFALMFTSVNAQTNTYKQRNFPKDNNDVKPWKGKAEIGKIRPQEASNVMEAKSPVWDYVPVRVKIMTYNIVESDIKNKGNQKKVK